MSSYFDDIRRQVADLSHECKGDNEAFLKGVMAIEKPMIRACELFAGDIETPEDVRQAIITCIALNQVRYDGGDFLGSIIGDVALDSRGAKYAAVSRASKLEIEMHSLWHDIARMRYFMRYGIVSDNPEWAVQRRDKFVEENAGKRHPWQKKPPTAGDEALRFADYRPPRKAA